jgi:hypothetical protein
MASNLVSLQMAAQVTVSGTLHKNCQPTSPMIIMELQKNVNIANSFSRKGVNMDIEKEVILRKK